MAKLFPWWPRNFITFWVYPTSALEEHAHHLYSWKCSTFHQSDETRQHLLFVQISCFFEQKLNLTTCSAQMFSSAPPQTAPRWCIVVLIHTKVNARLLQKHSYRHCAITTATFDKTKYSSPCRSALPYVTASNHLCCLSSRSFLTTCFMTNW